MFDANKKFLSAQFEICIPVYIQLFTLILHALLCYHFIVVHNGREYGAAMASNITYILNMVIIDIICSYKSSLKRTHGGLPDRRSFKNICTNLSVGIPEACIACFEWQYFILMAIFSGLNGTDSLAANVILVNLTSLVFVVSFGTGYAA